jgi:hypothetical protein
MQAEQVTWIRGIAAVLILAAAGSASAGNCPADVANLPAGQWCEVSNSHMSSVAFNWPAGVTFTKNGSTVAAVIENWSGGAFDTKRNRLIIWGGGHFAYGGNEIYAFDVPTLKWIRVNDPSIPVGDGSPYASDGAPTSRHTYDYLDYVPSIDRFCTFGGAGLYSDSSGSSNTDCFDFDALRWERKAVIPSTGDTFGSKAVYDPISGKVYLQTGFGGTFSSYDPTANKWTTLISNSSMDYYLVGAVDPVRRKLVMAGSGQLRVLDLLNPGAGFSTVSSSGDMTVVNAQAPGFVYDPVSDRFIGWNGGADVFSLNMDTMVWSRISPASGNSTVPTAPNDSGTYGRFRYIPSKNAFIVVNSVDEDVFIYKLSSQPGTSPPQAPAKPTVTVR